MALKAARRGAIPPFIVMDVMSQAAERARSHGDVLHLEVGQPSTPAPAGAIAAARAALEREVIGYTVAKGLPVLTSRIARHYREAYGVTVPEERIVATTGSSAGFLLSFLAAFEAGDRVALAAPGYPAYRNILRAVGVEPVEVTTDAASRFQPTPELLDRVSGRIDGLIVASPSNPTGTMVTPEELAALSGYCQERGIRLISDEIYHGLTFGRTAATALASSDSAVVLNSFSKYFSMTGWRIGWMVVPEDLLRPVECLAQNLYISPPTLSQHAAAAAFDCRDELDANIDRYRANRDLLLAELPKAGFVDLAPADGAFYLYAEISPLLARKEVANSTAFCRLMLDETGVATTPGVDFDPARGDRFLRLSFAGAPQDMAAAARRLQTWLG